MSLARDALIRATAKRYRAAGLTPYFFALNKIRYDPVFFAILNSGLIKNNARVLDLGCGQGLFLALLSTAESQYRRGVWADDLPAPACDLRLHGIELSAREVASAQCALGDTATIARHDLADSIVPLADVIVMLDVLHYLDSNAQATLIRRIAKSLPHDGLLLIREADAAGGKHFIATKFAEYLAAINRGNWRQRFCFRSRRDWNSLLESNGFAVDDMPMSAGTPFANFLSVARRVV